MTELGCFAKVFDDNPAVTAVQVGLWDHSGSLLASSSITPGSSLLTRPAMNPSPRSRSTPARLIISGSITPAAVLASTLRARWREARFPLRRTLPCVPRPAQPPGSRFPRRWPEPRLALRRPEFSVPVPANAQYPALACQSGPPFLAQRVSGLRPAIRAWPRWHVDRRRPLGDGRQQSIRRLRHHRPRRRNTTACSNSSPSQNSISSLGLAARSAFPGPARTLDYTLQSELGLAGTWADAGLPVTVVSNQFVAFDTIGPGPKYYRLLK